MSIEENKALARRWGEEIWGKANLAAIDELLATDFVFNYPVPGATPNLEDYKQTVTQWCTPFADIECPIEYMGGAPTGKRVTITGISILRIVGGKIVEEWGEMDNLGMMQQLGVLPPSCD